MNTYTSILIGIAVAFWVFNFWILLFAARHGDNNSWSKSKHRGLLLMLFGIIAISGPVLLLILELYSRKHSTTTE